MGRYNGGVLGVDNTPTQDDASGIWTLKEISNAVRGAFWPEPAAPDEFFANTVLLLQADDFADGSQNNTFLDSSTNAHTITRNGNVTQGSFSPFSQDEGKWGNHFDGNDALRLTQPASAGDFTMEFWVYFSSTNQAFLLGNQQSAQIALTTGFNWGVYSVDAGGIYIISASTGPEVGQWYHVALVRNSGTSTLYVDGTSVGTSTASYTMSATTCYIGEASTAPGDSRYTLYGYISNARLVGGTALYTSTFTPPTEPLTAISGTSLLTCQSNRFVDNSSNAHSITVAGDPEVVPFSPFAPSTAYDPATKGGSALLQNVAGDNYLTTDWSTMPTGTEDFTIEFWMYKNSQPKTYETALGNRVGSSDNFMIFYGFPTAGGWFLVLNDSGLQVGSADIGPLKSWNHFAWTRSGNTFRSFVNGKITDTVISSVDVTKSYNTNYIFYNNQLSGADRALQDAIVSDMRIVKGTAIYTSDFTPPTAPLTEVSGTSLLCNFTNAGIYDGTGRNVLETVGNAQVDTAVFKYGTGSMQFDGTGDRLVIPDSEFFYMPGDWTVEGWVYPNALSGVQAIFSQWVAAGGSDRNISLEFLNTSLYLYQNRGGTNYEVISSSISNGQWTHFAGVLNGTTLQLFINGVSQGTTTVASSANNSTAPAGVGAHGNGDYPFNGYIDDLRITKGVARYTANFTPPAAKLEQQ